MVRPEIAAHFSQRLRVALAASGKKPADLSREVGVTREAVSKWVNGKCYPNSKKLLEVAKIVNSSTEWLLWPHPVDVCSTPMAPDGEHVKHIIRQMVIDEVRAQREVA